MHCFPSKARYRLSTMNLFLRIKCLRRLFRSKKAMIGGVLLLLPMLGSAASLRMEGDRAWLTAEDSSFSSVLQLFEQCGVVVLIDPALELNRITGEWENVRIDRLIQQLVSPHSYLLAWNKMESPLGELYQISSIRIFSEGHASAVQPLSSKGKVLDVVEGENGLKYIRGEIMIGFGADSNLSDLKDLLRKLGGTVVEVIDPPGIYRIKLNESMSVEEAMRLARAHKGVEAVEPNLAFPRIGNERIQLSGAGQEINLNLQPGETAIAIFDSGFDPHYADLPFIRGTYNALNPAEAMSDPLGHGTLVAMVASGAITPLGAEASEVGVPVLAIRTFDENGYTSSEILMRAIEYAVQSNISIINMSWGSEVDSVFMEAAMNMATQQGITLYASVGNENTGIPIFPAASPYVIGVGGLNEKGEIWKNSNAGVFVDQYQPAFVEFEGKRYEGTSISGPYAAFLKASRK